MVEEANVAGRCETAVGTPSLEELGRAFQNLPHPVVIHRRGIILWVNQAAADLVRAPSTEVFVGMDSLQFVAPEQREYARERQVALLRDGVLPGSSILRLLRFDGTELIGEAKAAFMEWQGEPAACLVVWDITAHYEAEQRLAWEATHDTLTSLVNRRGVLDELSTWSTEPVTSEPGVGVVIADLDGFKEVNDTLGHDRGDQVLVEVAERLRQLAAGHLVGRLGSDEFVVCVRGSRQELAALAEAVAAIRVALSTPDQAAELTVVPSVGAAWRPWGAHEPSVDELLVAADHAMYRAKRHQLGWVLDDLPADSDGTGLRR
ncbi:GGDEF domain-containing protein [Aciditerrimonas ferrireducens]|uniref:GGDEF domain-containing protein n=1 Tax=Aciditerrimonas ferrireducens TaxID=667306 RepID=UPI0020051A1B|nr:sensor domain-containing diguanylate cyclase [Aciditerrimonas ferrireducens]MCK4177651.1 sensor domain-containing diguanylate cyclase [Aciditerrimonas ferrireducens]